jgi:hypothetical protein
MGNMEQSSPAAPPPPPAGPGEYGYPDVALPWYFHLYGLLAPILLVMTIWLAVDAYRRYGLCYWHFLFFMFTPVATPVYLIVHGRSLFQRRDGSALFGPSLRTRIARAERELRMAGTIAARTDLADLYFQAGRFADCEEPYGQVLAAEHDSLEARFYLGCCRVAQKDYPGGLAHLEKVMAANPKFRFGLAALRYSECLWQLERMDEALEERRKLRRSFPRPLFEFAYAEILVETGRKDEAKTVLEEMLDEAAGAPGEDRVWLKRGRSLLRGLS